MLYFLLEKKVKGIRYTGIVCLASFGVVLILPIFLKIPQTEVRESLAVPLQQTGYFCLKYPDEVTDDEKTAIADVVPIEALENYNPEFADPIKEAFVRKPSGKQLDAYFSVWKKQFTRHPLSYLKAFYLHTYKYYTPYCDLSSFKPHAFIGFNFDEVVYENTSLARNDNSGLEWAREMDEVSLNFPIYGMLSKIGIYTWGLLVAAVRLIHKRRHKYLLCFSPMIMTFIGCLFSPVNGYYRYAFPLIICTPFLFMMCMQFHVR